MDKNEDLKNINSVVCEEINYWLSRYKFNLKYMNDIRFNFF